MPWSSTAQVMANVVDPTRRCSSVAKGWRKNGSDKTDHEKNSRESRAE